MLEITLQHKAVLGVQYEDQNNYCENKSYRNSRSFFSSDQSNTELVRLTPVDNDNGNQFAGEQLDTACYTSGQWVRG